MELLCPHCVKRVTFPDDKAGQVLNCPLCSGVFAAPSLAPAPMRHTAPPPPPPEFALPSPVPQPEPAARVPLPEPVPPPAGYTRELGFRLRPDVLVAVPPACIFLIFVLSFFTWHDLAGTSLNLWQLGFTTEHGSGVFLAYTLLTFFLAFPLAVACVVIEHRWLPTPPGLVRLMPWKSLLTFIVLTLTFVLFAYDYQQGLFASTVDIGGLVAGRLGNPILMAEKLAFRLHLLAVLASVLELWAQGRQARHLPLPRFTMQS